MVTLEEMLEKLDEVAEMSDMIGIPAPLVGDDMWIGSGDLSDDEEDLLFRALGIRFGVDVVSMLAAALKTANNGRDNPQSLGWSDNSGHSLYVVDFSASNCIFAIGEGIH